MITLDKVGFEYAHTDTTGLDGITLHVRPGEVVVLTGGSGCGKTTLTKVINGLIPHVHDGVLTGSVLVAGQEPARVGVAGLADTVGSVFQNPRSQFFTLDVGSELAFAAENLGHPEPEILQRITQVAQRLALGGLLDRSIFALSGGQKQKVACGSVWTGLPAVVVLDEPSSNLDRSTIDDLRTLIATWKTEGCAVVVAEHRLHYLQGVADRWLLLTNGRITAEFSAARMSTMSSAEAALHGLRSPHPPTLPCPLPSAQTAPESVVLTGFTHSYPGAASPALDIDHLAIPRHAVVAITGDNGSGKSTLARLLTGLEASSSVLQIGGHRRDAAARLRSSFLVMQDVNHQLFTESVAEEIRLGAPRVSDFALADLLHQLDLLPFAERHPLSLSGGEKQRVAIAAALASEADVVVLDEPTSGLDLAHMHQVAERLVALREAGRLVVVITHDDELIQACATYLVELSAGRVVRSGPLPMDS